MNTLTGPERTRLRRIDLNLQKLRGQIDAMNFVRRAIPVPTTPEFGIECAACYVPDPIADPRCAFCRRVPA